MIVRDPIPPPGGWKSLTDLYLAQRGLQRLGGPVVSVDTVSTPSSMEEEEKQASAPTAAVAPPVHHRSPSASPTVVSAIEEKKSYASAVRSNKSTAAPTLSAVAAKLLQPTPPAPRLAYTRAHSTASSANAFRLVLRPVAEANSQEGRLRQRLVNILRRHRRTRPQQLAAWRLFLEALLLEHTLSPGNGGLQRLVKLLAIDPGRVSVFLARGGLSAVQAPSPAPAATTLSTSAPVSQRYPLVPLTSHSHAAGTSALLPVVVDVLFATPLQCAEVASAIRSAVASSATFVDLLNGSAAEQECFTFSFRMDSLSAVLDAGGDVATAVLQELEPLCLPLSSSSLVNAASGCFDARSGHFRPVLRVPAGCESALMHASLASKEPAVLERPAQVCLTCGSALTSSPSRRCKKCARSAQQHDDSAANAASSSPGSLSLNAFVEKKVFCFHCAKPQPLSHIRSGACEQRGKDTKCMRCNGAHFTLSCSLLQPRFVPLTRSVLVPSNRRQLPAVSAPSAPVASPATDRAASAASTRAAADAVGVSAVAATASAAASAAETSDDALGASERRRLQRQLQESKRHASKVQSTLSASVEQLMAAQTAANARIAELSDAVKKLFDMLSSETRLPAVTSSQVSPSQPAASTTAAAAPKRSVAATRAVPSSAGNLSASKPAKKSRRNDTAPVNAVASSSAGCANFGRNITNYFAAQASAGKSVFGDGPPDPSCTSSSSSSSSSSTSSSSSSSSSNARARRRPSSKDERSGDELEELFDEDEGFEENDMGSDDETENVRALLAVAHDSNRFATLSS